MNDNNKFSLKENLLKKRTLLSFAVAFIILYFLFTKINVSETIEVIKTANPFYFLIAFILYYASFPIRGLRWKKLLENTGFKKNTKDLTEILFISFFVNCIVPAKLGDVYRGYMVKKNYNTSGSMAIGTIFIERIFDLIVLVMLLGICSFLIFGDRIPPDILLTLKIGYALCIILIIGLMFMKDRRGFIENLLPDKINGYYLRFQKGVSSSVIKSTLPLIFLYTLIIWAFEIGRLYFVMKALNMEVLITIVIFIALAAALLTTIPLTPAGLGIVEASVVGVLLIVGIVNMNENIAVSIAFIDRIISYWGILIIGSVIFLLSDKK